MPRSSAHVVSYDLRPAKQSERRILVDLLKAASDSGLPIIDYRYVGMGANRFYDFLLIHKFLGLASMISLERDRKMYKRAKFNCPYSFIDVQQQTAATFIQKDSFESNSVLWLDYDGGVGSEPVADISALSTKLKVGDFCFVTLNANPPKVLAKENDEFRLAWLQDNLPGVAGEVLLADVETSTFPSAVHKVLIAAFRNAFAAREDGKFYLCLQVQYMDSSEMITVGGALLTDAQRDAFAARARAAIPFLRLDKDELYEIRSLHLTERERALFDRATTSTIEPSPEGEQLKTLGFKRDELSAYKDLIRYLPRYVETMV
jgi:hypothetical protein